jgi:hypothetical protein
MKHRAARRHRHAGIGAAFAVLIVNVFIFPYCFIHGGR